jgi:hypothetical protein
LCSAAFFCAASQSSSGTRTVRVGVLGALGICTLYQRKTRDTSSVHLGLLLNSNKNIT